MRDFFIFYQKSIMPVGRINFDIGGVRQVVGNMFLLIDRAKKIALYAHYQSLLRYGLQYLVNRFMPASRKVMAIHCLRKQPITLGVETLYQLVALVVDVR